MYYFPSLKTFHRLIHVEKIGIMNTTTIAGNNLELNVTEVFMMSSQAEEIMHCSLGGGMNFIGEGALIIRSVMKTIAKMTRIQKSYVQTFFGEHCIMSYRKGMIVFIAICALPLKVNLLKMYLEFIATVFYNYIGPESDLVKDSCNDISMRDTANNDNKRISNTNIVKVNENFQAKLFEIFFVYSLTKKFYRVIKYLVNDYNREMNNDHSKDQLANIYVVDVDTYEILFDMKSIMNKKTNVKYKQSHPIIWNVIKKVINQRSIEAKVIQFKSTFPRVVFIIRYLEVSNGLVIIEEINSLELSHMKYEKYDEYVIDTYTDILKRNEEKKKERQYTYYPNQQQDNKRIIFGVFIEEYFSLIDSLESIAKYHNGFLALKYFDNDILTIIDETLGLRISFDNVIKLLRGKFACLLNKRNGGLNIHMELFKNRQLSSDINRIDYEDTSQDNSNININGKHIISDAFLQIETNQMLSEIVLRDCHNQSNNNRPFHTLNKTINDELGVQISDITNYIGMEPDTTFINSTFIGENSIRKKSIFGTPKYKPIEFNMQNTAMWPGKTSTLPNALNSSLSNTNNNNNNNNNNNGNNIKYPSIKELRTEMSSQLSPSVNGTILKRIQLKLIKFDDNGNYFNSEKKKSVQFAKQSHREKVTSSSNPKKLDSDMENDINQFIFNEYYLSIK